MIAKWCQIVMITFLKSLANSKSFHVQKGFSSTTLVSRDGRPLLTLSSRMFNPSRNCHNLCYWGTHFFLLYHSSKSWRWISAAGTFYVFKNHIKILWMRYFRAPRWAFWFLSTFLQSIIKLFTTVFSKDWCSWISEGSNYKTWMRIFEINEQL